VPASTSSGPSTSEGSSPENNLWRHHCGNVLYDNILLNSKMFQQIIPVSGCVQQVLVQTEGNVIFSFARCWRRSLPSELKRNTDKARCSFPRGRSGQKMCVSYLLSAPVRC
jgi:hypothetical protein